VQVYPDAECWGKPLDSKHWCHSVDEVILPYLVRTVWLRKKRRGLTWFCFEIQDTDGWIVLPDWIEYFDTAELVPPAKWDDLNCEVDNDIWLGPFEERWIIIEDLIIVTG
jgi:hypothetical protein